MTSRDFCFWLQGYFELGDEPRDTLNTKQVEIIRRHLALVFVHEINPSMGPPEHQAKLNEVHVIDEAPKPERPRPPIGGSAFPGGMMRC